MKLIYNDEVRQITHNHTHTQSVTHTAHELEKRQMCRTYFSVERLSNSLRRRKEERSALTVKINAVIYSGREETYVERARAGVSMRAYVYVREGQRETGACVKAREREGDRESEATRVRLSSPGLGSV